MTMIPDVIISSKKSAKNLLRDKKSRWPHFDAMISVGDPGSRPPYGYRFVPYRMRLEFKHLLDEDQEEAPQRNDIERIIRFAGHSKDREDDRILIHCEVGKNRSTAAGLIYFAVILGPGKEKEAMQEMLKACEKESILPNELMIDIADDILERNGRLMEVFDNSFPSLPGEEYSGDY